MRRVEAESWRSGSSGRRSRLTTSHVDVCVGGELLLGEIVERAGAGEKCSWLMMEIVLLGMSDA